MNRDELLEQINEWYETDEHQKIIDAIEALPREEWGYELTYLLARAYSNNRVLTGRFETAASLLESVREDGKDDARWNFLFANALYHGREKEALPYFRRTLELDPDYPNAADFMRVCEEVILQKAEKNAKTSELAKTFMSYLDCECKYFPPMSDDDPIMAAYKEACRLAPKEGFVPMLISVDETLWECLILNSDPENDGAEGYSFDPKAVAAYRAEQLSQSVPDGKTILNGMIGDRKKEVEDDDMDWEELLGEMSDEEDEDDGQLLSIWNDSTRKTYPLILAKIPVKKPWEVFAYLPFGNWNECPDAPTLMAVAKYWYEQYGAVPAVMTHDELEFLMAAPVDEERAMELALEQYGFCPDIIYQAGEDVTVGILADHLHSCKVWYFWWD